VFSVVKSLVLLQKPEKQNPAVFQIGLALPTPWQGLAVAGLS
jgi:hypothetical protein